MNAGAVCWMVFTVGPPSCPQLLRRQPPANPPRLHLGPPGTSVNPPEERPVREPAVRPRADVPPAPPPAQPDPPLPAQLGVLDHVRDGADHTRDQHLPCGGPEVFPDPPL